MTPYYADEWVTLYHADWREHAPGGDVIIADPPYGQTPLEWDCWPDGWPSQAVNIAATLWCFGSLRLFMLHAQEFADWKLAQDIVWEKHNGSNFHADRFKRVHDQAVQFYRGPWSAVYRRVPTTHDATARTVRRKGHPPHTGHINASTFTSEDGGPRIMRSVFHVRSCHGYAENETQKPESIVHPLIEYSCPPRGTVVSLFAGSGTDLVVARNLGCKAIGFEVREDQCEIAAQRLSQETLELGA